MRPIAGAQVAVVRGGVVGYFESFGLQDRERSCRSPSDAIWRLYSMTKPITGVAMMTLYERGHFQLDDPVDRWIPEWKDMTVRSAGRPTAGRPSGDDVRDRAAADDPAGILTHTSGIGYGFENNDLVLGERNWLRGPDDLASMARRTSAAGRCGSSPGRHWLYSHGMDIAARLVEIMSGLPYDEYLRTTIFEPLGMTRHRVLGAGRQGRPVRRLLRTQRPQGAGADRRPDHQHLPAQAEAVQRRRRLVGTTADYLRFCTMLAGGGARRAARARRARRSS